MTRLVVAVCVCAMLLAGYFGWLIGRTTRVPAPRLAAIAPDSLAVIRKGELVYVPFRIRAIVPHGKGLILEIQPTKEAK